MFILFVLAIHLFMLSVVFFYGNESFDTWPMPFSYYIFIFRRLLSIIMMKSVHVSSVLGSGEEVHLVSRDKQTNAFSNTNKKHFNFRDALLLCFFLSLFVSHFNIFQNIFLCLQWKMVAKSALSIHFLIHTNIQTNL